MTVAGAVIVVTVDGSGGLERQNEVVAAVRASVAEIASVVVVALRAATPELAEWDVVDDATGMAPGPSGAVPPPPHPA